MADTKKIASKTAASSEKKPTAKNTTPSAKTTASKAVKTTAAADKKPAAKSSAKPAAAKTPAKKAVKKPAVTIDTICKKVEKMLPKTASFKEKIAVDIEVWGFEDGSNAKMYIEANDGKISVSPHTYDAKDFRVSVNFALAKAFVDGKMSLKEMVASPDFYAEGNIGAAVKLASIF